MYSLKPSLWFLMFNLLVLLFISCNSSKSVYISEGNYSYSKQSVKKVQYYVNDCEIGCPGYPIDSPMSKCPVDLIPRPIKRHLKEIRRKASRIRSDTVSIQRSDSCNHCIKVIYH